jgi:hypothetical protein
MSSLAAAAAALLALAAPPPGALSAQQVEQRRAEIARDLVRLGAELQREIVAEDADALLARVPAEGLRCAGRVVPRAKIARDLRGDGTWLHTVFFGAPGAAQRPGAPASLAAFLRTQREVAIAVSFHPDPRAGPVGRPCLDYRAKGVATPGAPLCFERRDGRWWFTESLYPCG